MPEILHKYFENNSKLIVWEVTEEIESLKQKTKLTPDEKRYIEKIKTPKRKTEYICVRFILQNILNCKKTIRYNNNGKPFIDNKTKLSISHSHNFIAVFIANTDIGVDIEKISDKPFRVKEKFLTSDEMSIIEQNNKIFYYTLFWSAKETIFKLYSDKHLAFAENINIQEFRENKTENNLIIKVKLTDFIIYQKVFYKKNANFVITWAQK